MDRDNFYIILELDFDKPEDNIDIINAAIESKQGEWSKNRNHPRLGTKMLQYLSMLDEIKRVMNDQNARTAEALSARKIAYEPLDRQIAIVCRKKKITEAEIAFLCKKYNLTREKVVARIPKNIEISSAEKKEKEDKLDSVIAKKINDNLDIIKKGNLYDFLDMPMQSSCDALTKKADEIYSSYGKKPKNAENEAICALAGICKAQLANDKKRALYDNYLKEQSLNDIKEMIDFAASGGEINRASSGEIIKHIMPKGYDYRSAVSIFKDYCKKKRYFVVLPEEAETDCAVSVKRCGVCGAAVLPGEGAQACTACGAPLVIQCPKCGTLNQSSNNNCLKCGFAIKNMACAESEIVNARRFIDEMDFEKAAAALARAEEFHPGRSDIQKLTHKLAQLRGDVENHKILLDKFIKKREFFAAREQLETLKRKVSGYCDCATEQIITSAISSAGQLAARAAMEKNENGIIDLCIRALDICSDCAEAKNLLRSYPLAPAGGLTVQAGDAINTLRWNKSASGGRIVYRVIKKLNVPPRDANDGELLCETEGLCAEDVSPVCAEPVYYAVFAVRGGIFASPTVSARPTYNFFDLSGIKARPDDEKIILAWDMQRKVKSVEIWRAQGKIPALKGAADKIFTVRDAWFSDSDGIINGRTYYYRIFACYKTDDGKEGRSCGITVKAVPNVPPKPLTDLSCIKSGDGIRSILYSEPENGEFALYYSDKPDVFSEGELALLNDAEERLSRLDFSKSSTGKIDFKVTGRELTYIYPAVVCGETAVFCRTFAISNVKGFSNPLRPRFSLDKMYLEFTWPDGADKALILYDFDKYPESPDDSRAIREIITRKSYETQAAAIIKNIQKRKYYVTVFAVYEHEKGEIYSDGLSFFASNEGVIEIRYTIKPKRSLFRKITGISLEVSCAYPLNSLPEMQLVKKSNFMPLNKNDGTVVATTDFKAPTNKQTIFFTDTFAAKTTCYKLFFSDEENYERYKISTTDISGLTVVI